jgi:hypothetical protein
LDHFAGDQRRVHSIAIPECASAKPLLIAIGKWCQLMKEDKSIEVTQSMKQESMHEKRI